MAFLESQGIFQGFFFFPYSPIHWTFLLPGVQLVLHAMRKICSCNISCPIRSRKYWKSYGKKKKLFLKDFPFQLSRPKGLGVLGLDNCLNPMALVQAAATPEATGACPPLPQLPAPLPPAFHHLHGCQFNFLRGSVKRRKGLKETL